MDFAVAFLRGLTALALFVVFGAGALLISPLIFLLRDPPHGQPVVRATWRFVVALFCWTRLIKIERGNLEDWRGVVLVANHPSLIDVVLLVSLVPRTLYVAKSALLRNPFLSSIVRATALPDDATLPDVAAPYLKAGWNVLIFPEGTRTPWGQSCGELKRGAAQLALRANAPVVCVRERLSRRILAKGQKPWDMGTERVVFSFDAAAPIAPASFPRAASSRVAASELTEMIRRHLPDSGKLW
jgi:1-acyl-sn-glycerol-3-phosphate acyltransferase